MPYRSSRSTPLKGLLDSPWSSCRLGFALRKQEQFEQMDALLHGTLVERTFSGPEMQKDLLKTTLGHVLLPSLSSLYTFDLHENASK
jgi:hypothetical protein